jgi:type III pantothenate kinase
LNLILDFGNTQRKLALFGDSGLVLVENHDEVTPAMLERFLQEHPGTEACILSSVIRHDGAVTEFLRRHLRFIELDEHTPIPIRNSYKTAGTLGKDRLAAAVAGASRFPGENVLVISAGTALTFDLVTGGGEYLGGAISPGMQMRFTALHTFTGKLPLVTYRDQAELTGTDTTTSILSGVINGMVAEIEGIAGRHRESYPDLKIILSGGDLDYFVKRLKISIFAIPNIVIHGLQQILSFNVTKDP